MPLTDIPPSTPLEGTNMNDFRPPKAKRRWYQYSLRTLLLLVLIQTRAGLSICPTREPTGLNLLFSRRLLALGDLQILDRRGTA
jgi:hypothetical protein